MNKIMLKDIGVDRDSYCEFATEGWTGFELIEERIATEDSYKDFAPATSIFKREEDGTLWAYDWNCYISHYGCGEHEFFEDDIYQVEKKEKTIVTTYYKAV